MPETDPKRLQEEIESNKERIAALEKELRKCGANEESLEAKIKSLEKEIQDLKKRLQEMERKFQKLEKENEDQKAKKDQEENVFIIIQVGHQIQRNMCEYVLGKYFKNWRFYKFKDINNYIIEIEHPADKKSANKRLAELNTKISWDQHLVDSLKNLNRRRIGIAHPELSSEKIQQATEFLSNKGELDEDVVKNIEKLKEQWETSESLLQTGSSSAGGIPSPRYVPTKECEHGMGAKKFVYGRHHKRSS